MLYLCVHVCVCVCTRARVRSCVHAHAWACCVRVCVCECVVRVQSSSDCWHVDEHRCRVYQQLGPGRRCNRAIRTLDLDNVAVKSCEALAEPVLCVRVRVRVHMRTCA